MFFEQLDVLYRGIILGIMVAAPVGPIGLLVIRRTVQKGILAGLATGLGAAGADVFFGAIAAFGVVAILGLLEGYQTALRLIGGAILVLMAWKIWRAHPQPPKIDVSVGSLLKALISGFVLTFTNPVTIFAILAVVTTLGGQLSHADATTLTAGIAIGSCAWWFLLSGGVALVRHHFNENTVVIINRATSVFLVLVAAWALLTGAASFLLPEKSAIMPFFIDTTPTEITNPQPSTPPATP